MNAIILCGGLSTRLGDIAKDIPKILLEIGGKTILDRQLEKLKKINVRQVVLAAGHLAHVLYDQVGEERLGMELRYAIEDKRLGTGGAIKHGREYLDKPAEPVFILNGDILYTLDFSAMAAKLRPDSDGIILGVKVEDASTYGTLEVAKDNRLLSFKEKEGIVQPGYINGGLYLFTKKVLKYFPKEDNFSMEYDVFPFMKDLDVYKSESEWIDIGIPERLRYARENYMKFNK